SGGSEGVKQGEARFQRPPLWAGCQKVRAFSSKANAPYAADPVRAATIIVAHTTSTFMRATSVEIRNPMPTIGVPRNSATVAPISARVEFNFSALNIWGSAPGNTNRAKPWLRVAA